MAVQIFWWEVLCNPRHQRNVCIRGIKSVTCRGRITLVFHNTELVNGNQIYLGKWLKWVPLGVCGVVVTTMLSREGRGGFLWSSPFFFPPPHHHLSMCTNVCPYDPGTLHTTLQSHCLDLSRLVETLSLSTRIVANAVDPVIWIMISMVPGEDGVPSESFHFYTLAWWGHVHSYPVSGITNQSSFSWRWQKWQGVRA